MIQIANTAIMVWALFKFSDKESYVNGFTSIAFVPAIFLFLASIDIDTFEPLYWILFLSGISYFLVPLLMLKSMTKFSWPPNYWFCAGKFMRTSDFHISFYK